MGSSGCALRQAQGPHLMYCILNLSGPSIRSKLRIRSGTAPRSNARMFWFQQFIFFMSDCFTSKRDELRLGQDLTEGNERKVTMKKPKDH
jgi:hypothetical protein